jgi:hypothetical protein
VHESVRRVLSTSHCVAKSRSHRLCNSVGKVQGTTPLLHGGEPKDLPSYVVVVLRQSGTPQLGHLEFRRETK